jgi:hypothetical protein
MAKKLAARQFDTREVTDILTGAEYAKLKP